ncbi:MAG: hypothetical protein KIT45_09975 [Fimbriimonadia bacterium]|nr:hypothetical protein [Fimbriimonadia bacterium]
MTAEEYYSLITAYVEERLSTDEFGRRFQAEFLNDPNFNREEITSLIHEYAEKEVSKQEFKRRSDALDESWLDEQGRSYKSLFELLNRLFIDWEVYYPECTPEQETPFEISEQTFRQTAIETKSALEQFLRA